jgi:1-acyl-sn-glycerol-3-phosphate acyltransferase
MTMFYWFIKMLAWPLVRLFFRFRRLEQQNVPLTGPCIVVANHTSYLDAICLGSASPRRLNFLINAEIYAMVRLRWFYHLMGSIPLPVETSPAGALRRALHTLRRGGGVAIFPEGERMEDGQVGEGKVGVAFLASRTGAPVIPAAIIGAHKAMPVGALLPRPLPIRVVFGRPLVFESLSLKPTREEMDDFADRVMQAIADLGAPSSQEAGPAGLGTAKEERA